MDESRFRNKIYWFTFAFSILVVWVHSYNSELFLGITDAAAMVYKIEHWLGGYIAQIAVPGFFMLSAYLFYRNFTWKKLLEKWDSRIHSLLVPFILWNALYYLGYVIASRIPFVTGVVGKGLIPFDLMTAADALLHYTYNYVFWYLYQLILLVLLAPVIYGALRNRYLGAAVILGIGVALWRGGSLPPLNLDALFYYAVAAYAAIHGRSKIETWSREAGFLGLFLVAIAVVMRYLLMKNGMAVMAAVAFRLLVPAALWLMVDEKKLPEAKTWMKHNFFLYAIHFAVVRLINKTAAVFFSGILLLPLAIYILMPVIVTALSYFAGRLFRKRAPVLWRVFNGNR